MLSLAAGVDTWKPCWYVGQDSDAARALDELATVGSGRGRMLPEAVAEHRVLWHRGSAMVAMEGHPVAGELAGAERLPAALAQLHRAMADVGVPLPQHEQRFDRSDSPGFGGLGRVDLTVDLQADSGREGLALLAGIAAVQPGARLASVVRRQPGGCAIETVSWMGTRGVMARAYDKGVESNLAARGERIRLEDQRRWPQGHRRGIEECSGAYLSETFKRRFVPLWRATKGVRVVITTSRLAVELKRAVEDGRITPGQAVDAIGHASLAAVGVEVGHRATRYRHGRILQDLGLVFGPDELAVIGGRTSRDHEAEVDELDLHEALEAAMCADWS